MPCASAAPAPPRPPELNVLDTGSFAITFLIALRDLLWLCQRDPSNPGPWGNALHYATLTFLLPAYAVLTGYASAAELRTASRQIHGAIKAGAAYLMAQALHLAALHYARPLLGSTSAGRELLRAGA